MQDIRFERFDPLLAAAEAESMLELCERFGRYGMYSEESTSENFGEGLQQRHDAVLNFLKTGGRFGRPESIEVLAARTNYFRETYAYAEPLISGIEPFLNFGGFTDAARKVFDRPIVRPAIVYANLLVPGQELAVHTDVPEFRGASRLNTPQWLLVAAHHSGLFDAWRMPIATAVSWFGHPTGGDFVFYPEGPFGQAVALAVRHNTAILLDTDSAFHGVDRVSEDSVELAPLKPGMALEFRGDGQWAACDGAREVARYRWDDLRFSISWKAHCYLDEADERRTRDHSDDLSRARILETLTAELRRRGRIDAQTPDDTSLALMIIEQFIQFPPAAPNPPS